MYKRKPISILVPVLNYMNYAVVQKMHLLKQEETKTSLEVVIIDHHQKTEETKSEYRAATHRLFLYLIPPPISRFRSVYTTSSDSIKKLGENQNLPKKSWNL